MVEKYQTLKILLFKIILFFSWLSADIGHLNYIYEGQAFDKPVRVIIKSPGVVPGLADIIVKSFDQEIDQILIQLPLFGKNLIIGIQVGKVLKWLHHQIL